MPCSPFRAPRHRGNRELVADRAEPGDDPGRRLRDEGVMPERLALVDIAHMHFDDRLLEGEQRIENRDRRVSQAGAVDDQAVGIAAALPGSSRSVRPHGWTGGSRASHAETLPHACGSAPRSAESFRCHKRPRVEAVKIGVGAIQEKDNRLAHVWFTDLCSLCSSSQAPEDPAVPPGEIPSHADIREPRSGSSLVVVRPPEGRPLLSQP